MRCRTALGLVLAGGAVLLGLTGCTTEPRPAGEPVVYRGGNHWDSWPETYGYDGRVWMGRPY